MALAFQSDNDRDVHLTAEREGEQICITIRDAAASEAQYAYLAADDVEPLVVLLRELAKDARDSA